MNSQKQIRDLSIGLVVADASAWPRAGLDHDRVAEFMDLLAADGPEALPPIEVVRADGNYVLADGWHRLRAHRELGIERLRAVVLEPAKGQSSEDLAYERALETATKTAKPLSRGEKRTALARLIGERPEASDRQIAALVGVDHKTVGAMRRRLGNSPREAEEESQLAGERYSLSLGVEEMATRLVRDTNRVWEARGLAERMLGDRVGRRLAEALEEQHGDDAREWAVRLHDWATVAVAELDRRGGEA